MCFARGREIDRTLHSRDPPKISQEKIDRDAKRDVDLQVVNRCSKHALCQLSNYHSNTRLDTPLYLTLLLLTATRLT